MSVDASKKVELSLLNDGDTIVVRLLIRKVRAEHEHRHVLKYLPTARDKAVSKLKAGLLRNVKGEIGQSRLDVQGDWYLPTEISSEDIKKMCVSIVETRDVMELS